MGIAPASAVVGYSGTISVPDLRYSLGGEPNISLGSVLVNSPTASYDTYLFAGTGKAIPGVSAGTLVNVDYGTVTQTIRLDNYNVTHFSGRVQFVAYLSSVQYPSSSASGNWLTGTQVYPSSWRVYSGDTLLQSGNSRYADLDFDTPNGVYMLTIEWYFGVKSQRLPNTFAGNTCYPSFRMSTTVYAGTSNSSEANQQEIIAGINETNSILGGITSTISNILNTISQLPTKIADAIKGLFVPSQEDLTAIKVKYDQLLADRLGFVYQAGDMVTDFFTDFSSALQSDAEYEFVFPGIAFPMNGEMIVICEEMPVDLDNDVMAALRPVLGTIITIISVLGFLNVASDMFEAMISGKSYHDFLHRKDDDG